VATSTAEAAVAVAHHMALAKDLAAVAITEAEAM
jgi:hypothetical protein